MFKGGDLKGFGAARNRERGRARWVRLILRPLGSRRGIRMVARRFIAVYRSLGSDVNGAKIRRFGMFVPDEGLLSLVV
jgi:hypothetical protein